jgi:hypothetical protein
MEQRSEQTPQQKASGDTGIAREISLVRGGPFYRAQEAIRLLTPGQWNLGRRIAVAVGVGWAPLVVLTLLFKPHAMVGLLKEYPVNARMLIAVPVLLAGQMLMENVFRMVLRHIHEAELLSPPEQAKLDLAISKLVRWRDSIVAEVIIVAIAYLQVAIVFESRLQIAHAWALNDTGTGLHLSAAAWYYERVSQLIYLSLLGISLWKWLLWTRFLFVLARLDLELVPTHPDRHGGLGFLGMSPVAIAPTLFVASAAIGSTWRNQILMNGAHLKDFKIDAIVLLVIMLVVAAGPLVFFVPKLGRLRRMGILQYGTLGQLQSTEFHQKWILNRTGHEDEFLAAPEISSLIDYADSYENVEKMQPFPLDRGALVIVVLAVAIPMLPVVLAEIPFVTVLKGLLSAVK